MPAAIAAWRFVPGFRVTDPAKVVSVDLEAYTETKPLIFGGEGDVHYVRFQVRNAGGALLQEKFSVGRSLRFPNYSAASSPIPGALSGRMAGVWGYGVSLDPTTLPAGKITISATVYSQKGTITTMSDVWWWNDTVSDSRYCSKQIVVNSVTGNDANPGSPSLPVRTLKEGLRKARKNHTGSSSSFDDMQCGGAEIIATGTFDGIGPWEQLNWVSQDQWLTVTATPGTVYRNTTSGNYFSSPGVTNQGVMRLRWVGWTFKGKGGPTYYVGEPGSPTAAQAHVWVDGLQAEPSNYSPARPWSMLYYGESGEVVDFTGYSSYVGKAYYSCYQARGRDLGFEFSFAHDCLCENYLGIAMQTNQRQQNPTGANIVIRNQRYVTPDVHGLLHCRGTNLRITVPAAGQMRLEQVGTVVQLAANESPIPGSPTVDIAVQLVEMQTSTLWRYRFSGCTRPGNNGSFSVLSSGYGLNGNPFVIFSNPSAEEEILSSTPIIVPVYVPTGERWYERVHPDVIQFNVPTTDSLFTGIVAYNIDNSQGFYGPHLNTRLAMVNCTDGVGAGQRDPFGQLVDCLFIHNSFAGQFAPSSTSGCSFEENVFGDVSGTHSTSASWWNNNHFVAGQILQS